MGQSPVPLANVTILEGFGERWRVRASLPKAEGRRQKAEGRRQKRRPRGGAAFLPAIIRGPSTNTQCRVAGAPIIAGVLAP